MKVILFMLSLQHTIRRPFLIISTSNSLSVWEAEFLHVAPSANFIVYKGNKDVRSSIRSLEFRNEGGRIMFEVLLSSSNIVIEVPLFLTNFLVHIYVMTDSEHLKHFFGDKGIYSLI